MVIFSRSAILASILLITLLVMDGGAGLVAQAVSPLDSLRQLLQRSPPLPSTDRADVLHEMGKILDDEGAYASAINCTEEALAIRLKNEERDPEAVLISAFNLGLYHHRIGQFKEAIDYFDLVIRRAPNRKVGTAYFHLGRCYRDIGEYEAAALAYREAGKYAPFLTNDNLQAELAHNAGASLLRQEEESRLIQAVDQLRRAEKFAIKAGATNLQLNINNDLGLGLVKLGQYQKAIALLTANLAHNDRVSADEEIEAVAVTHLGLAYRRAGQTEDALREYRRALAIDLGFAEGAQPDEYVAVDYDNLSTLYLTTDVPDSALYYANLALDWHLADYAPSIGEDLPSLALMTTGDQLPTLTYLNDKARAHQALADRGAAEHYGYALATYRRADELLDRMRQDQLLEGTRTFWRADARTLYARAIDAAVAAGDPVSAFYFMEKARARLLLDELSAGRAVEDLPENLRESLTSAALRTRLAADDPAQVQEFRRFQDSIFTAFPRFAQARIGAPPPDPARFAEILGPNRTLVEYFVSDERTLALRWSARRGLAFVELAPPTVWSDRLKAYRESLTDPQRPISATEARFLYAQLVAPLKLEPGDALTIVPDGDLYLLPFGALLTDLPAAENTAYRDWPWLAQQHDVHYAFSVQLLDFARARRGRGNGRVLALAPVARLAANSPLSPRLELPATLRTVRHLASLFTADTLINAAASPDAFREMADAYSIVHLGTHAYLDDGGSFLLYGTSASQHYTMFDLAMHHLQADLVVMGACETGLGKQLPGEGIASLGRGFARQGAPAIIMSLWSIDDATTAELLNATYDGLAGGAGPSGALHRAGKAYRADVTNPSFGHPYYWAGLVYYGPEAALDFGKKTPWWPFLLGALALVAGCWWIMNRLLGKLWKER